MRCTECRLCLVIMSIIIISPHRRHALRRCCLLLDAHVAWSVSVFVCVCIGHTASCAKTAEPIEMPSGC